MRSKDTNLGVRINTEFFNEYKKTIDPNTESISSTIREFMRKRIEESKKEK